MVIDSTARTKICRQQEILCRAGEFKVRQDVVLVAVGSYGWWLVESAIRVFHDMIRATGETRWIRMDVDVDVVGRRSGDTDVGSGCDEEWEVMGW